MPSNPRAKYVITAEDQTAAAWRKSVANADSAGRKLTGIMKAAFAGVSIAAITGAIKASFAFGDEIGKAAVKAGIGAQAMSELAFAARMSDIEIGALSTSLRKMQVELSKAVTGGKEQKEALAALGLEIDEIKRLAPDRQFEVIGDAISRLRDPMDRARAATVLFGRAGADLLPLFEQGAEGLRKAREEAQTLGLAFSEEQVRLLQEGDDAIKRLGAAWDGFIAKLAVGTVKFAQAVDLIEKDQATTASNLLQVEANRLDMMQRGQLNVSAEELKRQEQKVRELRAQLQTIESTFTRGGGPRRGRGTPSAPGFERAAASGIGAFSRDDFDSLMEGADLRRSIVDAQEWRATVDDVDSSTRKWLEGTSDLADELQDLPEPILHLSESLIQADELQKEFTRSMFQSFSDLFMSIGEGSDDFADSLLNAFKRVLADRATLELFNLLSGLGGDLTSSSGGKGLLGLIGSGLTSLFGGTKAKGGPLQQGKWYVAGERGPEPIWGGGAGAFAMGYGGGGAGPVVNINTNIDARGSTPDAIKLLPEVLKRNNDALEARIVSRLKSGRYG